MMLAKKRDEVLGKVKHIASTLISPGTKRALKLKNIYVRTLSQPNCIRTKKLAQKLLKVSK